MLREGALVGFKLLLVAVALSLGCQCGNRGEQVDDRSQKEIEIAGFGGTIDNRSDTHDPELSELYVRGSEALQAGDVKAAEVFYRRAIAKYPADSVGYSSLGGCLVVQGKLEDAKAEYMRGLKLNPQSVAVLSGLGNIAHRQKRYAEAQEYLEKALAIDQDDRMSHVILGMVFEETGDTLSAVRHYERALELNPASTYAPLLTERLKTLKKSR